VVVVLLVLVHSSVLYHGFEEEGFWLCSMEEEG
jgi:hypothetical protein